MINQLTPEQKEGLMTILAERFEKNKTYHLNVDWMLVREKLMKDQDRLWSLYQMESTGGEPDVVAYDETADQYIFYDCSAESPKGRRSLCYDREALDSRKENKPVTSALDMAFEMGIAILTEEQYRELQKLGNFDLKTSSWVETPPEIRKLGGAIFCDNRYNTIFVYHNGAESYYASRGFRGSLRV